jgi:hypothetical protein
MITKAKLLRFRCFEDFELADLGRVNLVVGSNGAGKTSLLEGIRLLRAGGNPMVLLASAMERGEYDSEELEDGRAERVAKLHFAFYGREPAGGASFRIAGSEKEHELSVDAEVVDVSHRDDEAPLFGSRSPSGETQLTGMFPDWAVRLTRHDGARTEVPLSWSRSEARRLRLPAPRADARMLADIPVFLRANAVNDDVLGKLWDLVVASPAKDEVIASLRKLEPNVRDVDLRADPQLPFRSRVALRIDNGESSRAPIGSFGEGVTWMFALALAAAATPGSLLLVDDIDAGLHHRVMADMWTMIIDAALRRDLQIFATTHSIDCLRALHRVCAADPARAEAIRVVRVVKGHPSGITFDAEELDVAIEGEIEVRG